MKHGRIHAISTFGRLNYFGFTSSIALSGVAASDPSPGGTALLCVVAAAAAFHVFAYVQNDVFDLEIDRTQPLRQLDPLVSGQVSPRFASWFAHSQVPLALLLVWLGGGGLAAGAAILIGFALMTVYNAYGKRFVVPIVTDAIQAVSWGTLGVFGASMVGETSSPLAWLAAAFGFSFIFLINGVHGGLRDLRNDSELGCRTTAIYLGATAEGERTFSTRKLQFFAFFALSLYIVPGSIALASGSFGYSGSTLGFVWAAWIMAGVANAVLLWPIVRTEEAQRNQKIRRHGVPLLIAPLVLFFPRMDVLLQVTTVFCFIAPFLLFDTQLKSQLLRKTRSLLPIWRNQIEERQRGSQ